MGEVESGFGKITEHIFKLDIPNKQGAIAVYSYLCFRGGSNKFCFPSQATIAAAVGVSRSTVNRNLKILEEKGLVKKINKKRDNNSYMSSFYILLKLVESSEELRKIEKKIEDLVSSMKQGCITHDTRVVSPVEQGCITHDTITDTINNNKEQNIYNNDVVVEDKDIEQESLSTTATAIINKLNSICNSNYRSTEVVKRYIQKLFNAGYTEQDMNLVLDIKVKEFVKDKKLAMTKPKNLFGDVNRFDELLQEANNKCLNSSISSYKNDKKEKNIISPEWEENSNKSYSEATEEEKQELLQQLEKVRSKNKGEKEDG